jgi:hypothetical protein
MLAPLHARNDSETAQTETARTVAQKRVLADNRPEAAAQRKLAEMMNNSPRVLQQRALSDAFHNSPRMMAQRHEMNALFGGAVKPQGDGAMPAKASLAQREKKTNNTGLSDQLKSGVEALSGMSMDHVKVHYNSDKPAQLQAHAYAQGSEIHLGAGQERHLPHEAWHVVQQAQGRVRPTLQMKSGTAVNDNPALEAEADAMGARAFAAGGAVIQNARRSVQQESGSVSVQAAGVTWRSARTIVPGGKVAQLGRGKGKPGAKKTRKAGAGAAGTGKGKAKFEHFRSGTANRTAMPIKVTLGDTASKSEEMLHVVLHRQLYSYGDWLSDDKTWAGRDPKVLVNREAALKLANEAHAIYTQCVQAVSALMAQVIPDVPSARRYPALRRGGTTEFLIKGVVEQCRKQMHELFGKIDGLVTEPPVPPKTWNTFMGDQQKYVYHTGTSGDPIPVLWYKHESYYQPITVQGKHHAYPNGPTVKGRAKKYDVTVASKFRYGLGTVLENTKKNETRATQVDINYALTKAGATLNGLDGDHVTDLGFGGSDIASNYWPLAAHINRRPFLGWRSNYGVNYISSNGQYSTAALGSLTRKYLIIKGFMDVGSANVPAEGMTPDPKSGTHTV